VPPTARLRVRVGHPRDWTSDEALAHVRAAINAAAGDDPWLRQHPPTVRLSGYRAQRHAQDLDTPLVRALAEAHASAHGSRPDAVTIGSTTDARYYLNQFDMPAVAYGPRTRNIHGTDECVELASIVDCARTVARFLRDWYRSDDR
jgi:acetylornithine deacetylase